MKMEIVHPTLLAQLIEDRDTARAELARIRRKVEGAMATLRSLTTDAASTMRQLEEVASLLNSCSPAPIPGPSVPSTEGSAEPATSPSEGNER